MKVLHKILDFLKLLAGVLGCIGATRKRGKTPCGTPPPAEEETEGSAPSNDTLPEAE